MLINEAFAQWLENFAPSIDADDTVARSEDWNNYTDALQKDGELTALQYHYCPAYDDDMPGDDDEEREFLLDAMGVNITSKRIDARSDLWADVQTDPDATHWEVTISRGSRDQLTIPYSMGPAIEGEPTRVDVLYCLLMDWNGHDSTGDFETWAEEYCEDSDSRAAERRYNASKAQSDKFAAMFTDIDLSDLMEAFENY